MVDRKLLEKLKKLEENTDVVLEMPIEKFYDYLAEKLKLFKTEKDFKLFVLESMEKAFVNDNADYPIQYYMNPEPFTEEEKQVDVKYEALTDETVQQMKINPDNK
jgi:hypothetical protein